MKSQQVSKIGDLQPGRSRVVVIDGKEVALFNVEGCLYAIANRCPHRGGPLSRGHLETVEAPGAKPSSAWAIRCPLHGWLFDLKTGCCLNQPNVFTSVYPVICENR